MKDFIKLLIAIEAIVLIMFGIIWLIFLIMGKDIPLIALPFTMGLIFLITIITVIIAPVLDWWFSD